MISTSRPSKFFDVENDFSKNVCSIGKMNIINTHEKWLIFKTDFREKPQDDFDDIFLEIITANIHMTLAWGGGGGRELSKKSTQIAKNMRVCDFFNDIFGLRRRMTIIWCALYCPDPGECVRYPQHGL